MKNRFTSGLSRILSTSLVILLSTASFLGAQDDFDAWRNRDLQNLGNFQKGLPVAPTRIMSREEMVDAFRKFESTGDPAYASKILVEYDRFKNNRNGWMSRGVSQEQVEALDNWKREQLKKACNIVAKEHNGEFVLHRPGSSSMGAKPGSYIAGKSDDDIIPQLLKGKDETKLGTIVNDIKKEFKTLTGVEAESVDINFLTRDRPYDYDARARLGADAEKYTTSGGDTMLDHWLNDKGSTMVWDAKRGEMVEHLFRDINPAPPPLLGEHAFGYASDNIRQMEVNILNNHGMSDGTKLTKLYKYADRNRDALYLAGKKLNSSQQALMQESQALINQMKKAAADNKPISDALLARVKKAIDSIKKMNRGVFQTLHYDYINRISAEMALGKNETICPMVRELAGSYQNYVGHLPRQEQLKALKDLLGSLPNMRGNTAYKAIYTAVQQQRDLNAAINHIKDLNLESFQNIVNIQVESRRTTGGSAVDPKADVSVDDLYLKDVNSKGMIKGAQAISKVPENGWMIKADTLDDAYAAWKPGRLQELVDKGILDQQDKKEVLAKVRKLASAHLEEEIAQSWRNQHEQFKKFSKASQERIKSTQLVYNNMTLPSMKGIVARNALFAGGITFTMFAVKACSDGPHEAWLDVKRNSTNIVTAVAGYSFYEYLCVNILPSNGYAALGTAMMQGLTYGSLAAMAVAGLEYVECWFGNKFFEYIYDEPAMKSLYTLFFDYLEINNVPAAEKIGRDRKKLYPTFGTIEELTTVMEDFWNSSHYFQVTGPHFGEVRGTFQNWRKQVLSDWLTAGGKEAMEASRKYHYQDQKNSRLEKIMLSDKNEGRCSIGLLTAEIKGETPSEGEEFEAEVTYMVLGIPGRKARVEITAALIGPDGQEEETHHLKMYHEFKPDDISPGNVVVRNKLAAKFKLPGRAGGYQVRFVNTTTPEDSILIPLCANGGMVQVRVYEKIGKNRTSMPVQNASVVLGQQKLVQIEPGVYEAANIVPDIYELAVSAPGYTAEDGSPQAVFTVIVPESPAQEGGPSVKQITYLAAQVPSIGVGVADMDTGMPVKNAIVVFQGREYPVDQNGDCILEGLVPGEYKVDAYAEGYMRMETPTSFTVEPKREGSFMVLIRLRPASSTLSVTVKDTTGTLIKGATITVGTLKKTTGDDGKAMFDKLPEGSEFGILVEKPGFTSARETVKTDPKRPESMERMIMLRRAPTIQITVAESVFDPEETKPNNGNGKADAGENISLRMTLRNAAEVPSPAGQLALTSASPLVGIGKTVPCSELAPGTSRECLVPANISKAVKKPEVVTLTASFMASDSTSPLATADFMLPINPQAALDLELAGLPTVKDPDTGALAARNNANGILGAGELGYIYLKIRNSGPDAEGITFNLEPVPQGAFRSGHIQKKSQPGADFTLRKDDTIERMFEIAVPADYSSEKLTLKLTAESQGQFWSKQFSIPIEMRSVKYVLEPNPLKGEIGQECTVTANAVDVPWGHVAKWTADGAIMRNQGSLTAVVKYERPGTYEIKFQVINGITKESVGEAVVAVEISDAQLREHVDKWPNGKTKIHYTYFQGKPGKRVKHGQYTQYYETGAIYIEIDYDMGQKGKQTVYYGNGNKREEFDHKNNKKHGLWTYWYETGQKREEIFYREGKYHGENKYWRRDGTISSRKSYKDGLAHGNHTIYYNHGAKFMVSTYKGGKQIGKTLRYDTDGKLIEDTGPPQYLPEER